MNEKILIVDDDASIRYAFRKTFESQHYEIIEAANGKEVLEIVSTSTPKLIFMDITMPDIDGLEALEKIKQSHPHLPVIIITGNGNMQTAIKAMRIGAYDYLIKPLDIDKIRFIAQRGIEMTNMKMQLDELQRKLLQKSASGETNIIGNHPRMQEVYKKIGVVSTTPDTINILILGETGTGKELVAKAIHEASSASGQPFQAINCTVLPETLLESELFGHEKGAFTGAEKLKHGKFELAAGGTLFLDEIGDMPENLQKKLLRVIQERAFERLGGNEQIKLNARIIAATHRNLDEMMKKNLFRKDLYYRLNVIEIILPPLREKESDIPLLAKFFFDKFCEKMNKKLSGISSNVLETLSKYNFPGNVRELEHLIERAVALERGEVLSMQSLPQGLLIDESNKSVNIPILSKEFSSAKKIIIEAFEKKFLLERLNETSGNVSEAAKIAGIERQSFQRLMKKYNLSSEDFKNN